jgi:hypothetical protein
MLIPEVAKRLADRSDVVFLLCGEGVMREGLEGAAKDLQNMQVIPLQPFERFGDLLGVADIHLLPQSPRASDLVMPSKLSGMLASGRPVIATCNPGTELDAVVSTCGVVVPPEDSQALAEAIVSLADNATLRSELGRKARAYAESHFERDAVLRQMFGPLGSSARRAGQGPRGTRRVLDAVLAGVAAALLLPATWVLRLLIMPPWRARTADGEPGTRRRRAADAAGRWFSPRWLLAHDARGKPAALAAPEAPRDASSR